MQTVNFIVQLHDTNITFNIKHHSKANNRSDRGSIQLVSTYKNYMILLLGDVESITMVGLTDFPNIQIPRVLKSVYICVLQIMQY